MEMEDHVTPELKKALTCIEQEQPILRRFSKKEDKITCALTNNVSFGLENKK
ncbi:hypothetical protein [Cardinium endosymbiont of Tipula unca]|uniref:hypothetical protein n=1 Tax=Cardinium endosymbiont of Tipula unca TaxID=3066216 RepID=UPI0030CC603E